MSRIVININEEQASTRINVVENGLIIAHFTTRLLKQDIKRDINNRIIDAIISECLYLKIEDIHDNEYKG